MKTIIKFISLAITICLLTFQITHSQCHIDDWTALKALYESTDGGNWTNNSGWQEVTGNIPTSNCNLEILRGVGLDAQGRVDYLILYNNELIGSIPHELDNLSNLQELWLQKNQLSGSIPLELGNLSNLQILSLWGNELIGSIPHELGNLSNLQILSLWGNQLIGSIPPELGNLINLQYLWLDYNLLSGSIPPRIGKFKQYGFTGN